MGNLLRKARSKHSAWCIFLLVATVTVLCCQVGSVFSQTTREVEHDLLRFLGSEKPFSSELSSRQTVSLKITLIAGQCLRVLADHWGIDVSITAYGPEGSKITEVVCRRDEPTPLTLVADISGTYCLRLLASQEYPAQGRCQLTVQSLRTATAADKKCMHAENAATEAEGLRWQWKETLSRKAAKKYEEALALWRSAGEKREEAVALRSIGQIHLGLGNSREAVKYLHQALQINKALSDLQGQGKTLSDLCCGYLLLDENQAALGYCKGALELGKKVGDRRVEAQALCRLGGIYRPLGDTSKSISSSREALSLWSDLRDVRGQANALQSLGFAYSSLSENSKALESFGQSLDLCRTLGERRGQAVALIGLGHTYSLMGEKQEALNLYQQAKPLIVEMGDPYWEVGLVNGLAYVHQEFGEHERALKYRKQALSLDRAVGSREGEASDLREIGRIYFSLGNQQRALTCLHSALTTFRLLSNRRGASVTLCDIGIILESQGRKQEALNYYARALDLNRKSSYKRGEAVTLNHLGRIYWKLGDNPKAADCYEQALSLHRTAMNSFGESVTLYNLAVLERDRGHLDAARSQIEAALKVVESLRGKVNSHELRSSYFASERQRYDFYIDLLMQMHRQRPAEGIATVAFEASERSRARSFQDSLAESRADIRRGVDASLLEREQSLRRSLNAKDDRRMRLTIGKPGEAESLALNREIDQLTAEYQELQAEIRASSPRYAALIQPQPLTLLEIQQQVLDSDSILIEYALGEKRSYLWAVTPASTSSHELPSRAEVEKAASRVYELLIARQPKPRESANELMARISEADASYRKEAGALSQMLLGPVADQLRAKRVLVVAEGALQYLPFGALPKPEGGKPGVTAANQDPFTPLMIDHEVVNLPSASALGVLRREIGGREPSPKAVAVLADPVFEVDDPRLGRKVTNRQDLAGSATSVSSSPKANGSSRRRTSMAPAPQSELRRALRDAGVSPHGLSIPRLHFSRQEAESILAPVPASAHMKATDFRASRATAIGPALGEYRIVHFATHGLINSEHPELSGLVLSLVDEHGQPQDGFLRMLDIYNLNLPAELVVLSACNTGLGKEIRGEGLVGMVRGFMYAGAARVVASLWKVDDEATAELMKRFYQQMLERGLKPAAALRAAQMDMRQQKRWSSPYYWAGFVLQGEWK